MHDQYVAIPTSEVAMRDKEIERLEKDMAESQAREAALREAIKQINTGHIGEKEYMEALALPTDDTALKEFKRKVLMDAADAAAAIDGGECQISRGLRRMAEEL